jgi:hypothetical protein
MATHLRFLAEGDELERTEALKYPVLVAGDIMSERNAVAVFESNDGFLEWAKTTKYADKTAEVSRLISESPRMNKDQEKRLQAKTQETIRKLEKLSAETNMPIWSAELFARAHEAGVLQSSLLFRHINQGGDFRPIYTGIPVPHFGLIGFTDTASSALVSGVLLLCSRFWFRGARLWLYGAPAAQWNLTDFGFNDRAASGAAY